MIAGVRGSWQTIIADLALILFMVTAAAMGSNDDKAAAETELANPLPARGEPLAIYRERTGAPPLGEWLSSQPQDTRQRLTIISRYADGDVQLAGERALALASEAATLRMQPRIVLEQGDEAEVLAVLAFDETSDWHAHCTNEAETGAQRASRKDSACD